jgi:hypothetical protein
MIGQGSGEYEIVAGDSAPVVIGGLGGSGTRLVTEILQKEGVHFPGDMNDFLDNLWFSLLFVRKTILLKPFEEVRRLIWIFNNAMRNGLPIPQELLPLIDEAAMYDRGPSLRKAVLEGARETLLQSKFACGAQGLWGWKEPNSHILIPLLHQHIPQMKFIYVLRNGLDMAFSYNKNQLTYFWGDLLLEGDAQPSPENALRYWVASYKRVCSQRAILGNRLYIVNYDFLCERPHEQIELLNRFLDINVSPEEVERIAKSVVIPNSIGRYRHGDSSQLRAEDIDFVRTLGFDVQLGH